MKTLLRQCLKRFHRLVQVSPIPAPTVVNVRGFVPITDLNERDVFIAAYPKSGNTWFQNLTAAVVFGTNPVLTPDTLVQELVPDVHYKQFYKRFATPMYFKTHHLPRPEYKRVVCLVRDGRDVMVSTFHHLRALIGPSVAFDTMVRQGMHLFPCKWHEYVDQWSKNPYGAELLTIRYEDLRHAPVNELQRFCDFVGIQRETAFLQTVAAAASFENARIKEATQGWDNPAWPKDRFFVRRGVVGSFQDEMPPDLLHDFVAEAQAALVRFNYL